MSKLSVVCVDDDSAVLTMYQAALTSMLNADVRTAMDADKGLTVLTSGPAPDVVLIDYMMPGHSGLDLVSVLRAKPEFANSCLILHSAVGHSLKKTAVQRGVYNIIDKPVRLKELSAQITDTLRHFKAGDESPLISEQRAQDAAAQQAKLEKEKLRKARSAS